MALYYNPRQPVTIDYRYQITNGDPRPRPRAPAMAPKAPSPGGSGGGMEPPPSTLQELWWARDPKALKEPSLRAF